MHDEMKAKAQAMGFNWDDVKAGLKRAIPLLELVSTLTTNKYDDLVVAFLKQFLTPTI